MDTSIIINRKLYSFCKVFLTTFFLLTIVMSYSVYTVSADPPSRPVKVIFGTAEGFSGENVDGASVIVSATGFTDEITTVGGGAWQVDIGSDTGDEWPDGTTFTVLFTFNNWAGSNVGVVSGTYTNMGKTILYQPPVFSNEVPLD
ncbi:MAG: hypothetical protein DRN27_07495, partial [Thermoplasmata archaeon]